MTKPLIAALLAFVVVACDKTEPVTASFTVESTEVNKGETITFTNTSENATYYQWDFGDEGLSFDENPTHVYNQTGSFEVSLIAIGDGYSDTTSISLTVSLAYEVTIYEGVGIEGINLYDTWAKIKSTYSSDTIYYPNYDSTYDLYYKTIYYYEEGLAFFVISESTKLLDSDYLYVIAVLSPYTGATSMGITVGSTINEMKIAYGNPEETDASGNGYIGYYYPSIGIDFYTSDYSTISEIDIYPVTTSYSAGATAKSAFLKNFIPRLNFISDK